MVEIDIEIEKGFPNSRFKLKACLKISPANGLCVFFGPSGSGKTITMRCVAGLDAPDKGRIEIAKKVFYDKEKKIFLPPQKRHIGYMPQDYALFPHLNILQNVAYPNSDLLGRLTRKVDRIKAMSMLERFQIDRIWRNYPHEISGGQKQRAAIARALNSQPGLLLFDEPFSALDPLLRREMRSQTLSILRETGVPAVIITHDPDDVDVFAGIVVLFKSGNAKVVENYKDIRKQFGSATECLLSLQSAHEESMNYSNSIRSQ